MPTPAPLSNGGRWCDSEGTPIFVFAQVKQVCEDTEPTALPTRLHEQGQVVGRGDDVVFVRFVGGQVISVAPQLLRVLDDAGGD